MAPWLWLRDFWLRGYGFVAMAPWLWLRGYGFVGIFARERARPHARDREGGPGSGFAGIFARERARTHVLTNSRVGMVISL